MILIWKKKSKLLIVFKNYKNQKNTLFKDKKRVNIFVNHSV